VYVSAFDNGNRGIKREERRIISIGELGFVNPESSQRTHYRFP
jgi:hypothetical protein